jgi:hypothetical protein
VVTVELAILVIIIATMVATEVATFNKLEPGNIKLIVIKTGYIMLAISDMS